MNSIQQLYKKTNKYAKNKRKTLFSLSLAVNRLILDFLVLPQRAWPLKL